MNMRLNAPVGALALAVMFLVLCPAPGLAQTSYTEDFTSTVTKHQWFFFNGACLTAGSATAVNPGYGNGCTAIASTYYSGEPLVGGANGVSGPTQTLPDPDKNGALRLTNGCTKEGGNACNNGNQVTGAATNTHTYGGGHHQNGAIISNDTFLSGAGLQVTFKTVTYRGDGTGNGTSDGADGISFVLMDGSVSLSTYVNNFGAFGGSLGYTCTDESGNYDSTTRADGTVRGFDGMVGGFLGLGIDEYGNFLNQGDNSATGYGFVPGRIGLRGPGSISWRWLSTNYASMYPAALATMPDSTYTTKAAAAVHNTCANGVLYDYSGVVANANATPTKTSTAVNDYAAGPYKVVSGLFQIANEAALKRGNTNIVNTDNTTAVPITYNLKITSDDLLSLSYSYNGGAYQPVITGQTMTNVPTSYRFGFAGSTGGSSNIHEILCFKAAPDVTSSSSGGVNVFENPTIKIGTQLYLAYYFPSDWTGQMTAQTIGFNGTSLVIATTPNWDARCVLTGVNSGPGTLTSCSTGVTAMNAEPPAAGGSGRVMLTWNGSQGVPFEWNTLSNAQRAAIDPGVSIAGPANRLNFLRGVRTNEVNSAGVGLYRARDAVLSDIVDSSPTWVGPPQTYSSTTTFNDKAVTTDLPTETSYATFMQTAAYQGRQNVVYIGANDGFVHGFRAGSLDNNGNLVTTNNGVSTPNDGYEVLAYMPAAVSETIHNSSTPELDFSNTQYAHNWFVDATPATGDLFYGGAWHTWIVGGLGAGGAAIYALDVTNPANFSESATAAQNTVIGEWGATNGVAGPITLSCANVANCGQNLGNTYGTPLIRRFHNGSWGVIFGNGYGSASNASGIFIMLVNPSSGAQTFYYLGTPAGTSAPDGISNPASLDMDLDHIVDYIYGGDLQGNVWRFDVTDASPSNWGLSGTVPLFVTPSGSPITAGLTVSVLRQIDMTSLGGEVIDTGKPARVMINFGTGQMTPQSLTAAAQYATGTQYLFGIWDQNFNSLAASGHKGWNLLEPALPAVAPATATASAMVQVSMSTLVQQTITTVPQASPAVSYRTVTQNPICWAIYEALDHSSACPTGPGTQYGWYIQLPGTMEQIIFNPVISPDGELVVNTFIPSQDSPLSCNTTDTSTGFSMALSPETGGGAAPGSGFFTVNTNSATANADGIQLNGTGIPWFLSSGQKADNNAEYLITQTSNGAAPPTKTNRHTVVAGKRLNWIQRR